MHWLHLISGFGVLIILSGELSIAGPDTHLSQPSLPSNRNHVRVPRKAPNRKNKKKPNKKMQMDGMMNIQVQPCEEESTEIYAPNNKYVQDCVSNPSGKGFFNTIYICPALLGADATVSNCMPPVDCSKCPPSSIPRMKRAAKRGRRRKGRRRKGRKRKRNNKQPFMNINTPRCEKEGITMMQDNLNYYMECIATDKSGKDFYQILHLCPKGYNPSQNPALCKAPLDCASCAPGNDDASDEDDFFGGSGAIVGPSSNKLLTNAARASIKQANAASLSKLQSSLQSTKKSSMQKTMKTTRKETKTSKKVSKTTSHASASSKKSSSKKVSSSSSATSMSQAKHSSSRQASKSMSTAVKAMSSSSKSEQSKMASSMKEKMEKMMSENKQRHEEMKKHEKFETSSLAQSARSTAQTEQHIASSKQESKHVAESHHANFEQESSHSEIQETADATMSELAKSQHEDSTVIGKNSVDLAQTLTANDKFDSNNLSEKHSKNEPGAGLKAAEKISSPEDESMHQPQMTPKKPDNKYTPQPLNGYQGPHFPPNYHSPTPKITPQRPLNGNFKPHTVRPQQPSRAKIHTRPNFISPPERAKNKQLATAPAQKMGGWMTPRNKKPAVMGTPNDIHAKSSRMPAPLRSGLNGRMVKPVSAGAENRMDHQPRLGKNYEIAKSHKPPPGKNFKKQFPFTPASNGAPEKMKKATKMARKKPPNGALVPKNKPIFQLARLNLKGKNVAKDPAINNLLPVDTNKVSGKGKNALHSVKVGQGSTLGNAQTLGKALQKPKVSIHQKPILSNALKLPKSGSRPPGALLKEDNRKASKMGSKPDMPSALKKDQGKKSAPLQAPISNLLGLPQPSTKQKNKSKIKSGSAFRPKSKFAEPIAKKQSKPNQIPGTKAPKIGKLSVRAPLISPKRTDSPGRENANRKYFPPTPKKHKHFNIGKSSGRDEALKPSAGLNKNSNILPSKIVRPDYGFKPKAKKYGPALNQDGHISRQLLRINDAAQRPLNRQKTSGLHDSKTIGKNSSPSRKMLKNSQPSLIKSNLAIKAPSQISNKRKNPIKSGNFELLPLSKMNKVSGQKKKGKLENDLRTQGSRGLQNKNGLLKSKNKKGNSILEQPFERSRGFGPNQATGNNKQSNLNNVPKPGKESRARSLPQKFSRPKPVSKIKTAPETVQFIDKDRLSRGGKMSAKNTASGLENMFSTGRSPKTQQILGNNRASKMQQTDDGFGKEQLSKKKRVSEKEKLSGINRATGLAKMSGKNRPSKMEQGHERNRPPHMHQSPGINRISGMNQYTGKNGLSGTKKFAGKNRALGLDKMSGKDRLTKMEQIHGKNRGAGIQQKPAINKESGIDQFTAINRAQGLEKFAGRNEASELKKQSRKNLSSKMGKSYASDRFFGKQKLSAMNKETATDQLSGRKRLSGRENLSNSNEAMELQKKSERNRGSGLGNWMRKSQPSKLGKNYGGDLSLGNEKSKNQALKRDQLWRKNQLSNRENFPQGKLVLNRPEMSARREPSQLNQMPKSYGGPKSDQSGAMKTGLGSAQSIGKNKISGRDQQIGGNRQFRGDKMPPNARQNKIKELHGMHTGLRKDRLGRVKTGQRKDYLQAKNKLGDRDQLSGGSKPLGRGKLFEGAPPSKMMQSEGSGRGLRENRLDSIRKASGKNQLKEKNILRGRDQLSHGNRSFGGEKLSRRPASSELMQLQGKDRSLRKNRLGTVEKEQEKSHLQSKNKLRGKDQLSGGHRTLGGERSPGGAQPSVQMQLHRNDRVLRKDLLDSIRKSQMKDQLQEENKLKGREKLSGANIPFRKEKLSGASRPPKMKQLHGTGRGVAKNGQGRLQGENEEDHLQSKNKLRGRNRLSGRPRPLAGDKLSGRAGPSKMKQWREGDRGLRKDRLDSMREAHETDKLQNENKLQGRKKLTGRNKPFGGQKQSGVATPSTMIQSYGNDRRPGAERLDAMNKAYQRDQLKAKNKQKGKENLSVAHRTIGEEQLSGAGPPSRIMKLHGNDRGARNDRLGLMKRREEKDHLQANNKLRGRDQLSDGARKLSVDKWPGNAGLTNMKPMRNNDGGVRKDRLDKMKNKREKDHLQEKNKLRRRDRLSHGDRTLGHKNWSGGARPSTMMQFREKDRGLRKDKLDAMKIAREKDHSQAKKKLGGRDKWSGRNRPIGKENLLGDGRPSKMRQLHESDRGLRKDRLDSITKAREKDQRKQKNQLQGGEKMTGGNRPFGREKLSRGAAHPTMMHLNTNDRGLGRERLGSMSKAYEKNQLKQKNKVKGRDQLNGGYTPINKEKLSGGGPPSKLEELHGSDGVLRKERLDAMRRQREKYHSQAKNQLRGRDQLARENTQLGKEKLPVGNRPFGKQKLSGGTPRSKMNHMNENQRGLRKDGLDSIRKEHVKNQLQQDKNLQRRDKLSGANIPVKREKLPGRGPPSTVMQLHGKDRGLRKDELGSIRKEHGKNQLQQGNQLQRRDKFSGANIPVQRDRLSGRAAQSTRMQVHESDRGLRNNRLDAMRRDNEKDQTKSRLKGREMLSGGNRLFGRKKLLGRAPLKKLQGNERGHRKDRLDSRRKAHGNDQLQVQNELRGRENLSGGQRRLDGEQLFGDVATSDRMQLHGNDRRIGTDHLDAMKRKHGMNDLLSRNKLTEKGQLSSGDRTADAEKLSRGTRPTKMKQLPGSERGLGKERLGAVERGHKKDNLQSKKKLRGRDGLSGVNRLFGGEKLSGGTQPSKIKQLHGYDRGLRNEKLDAMRREREKDHSQTRNKLRGRDHFAGGNKPFGKKNLPVGNRPFGKQTLPGGGRPPKTMQTDLRKHGLGSIRKEHGKNQLQQDNQLQRRDKMSGGNMARKGERLPGRGPPSTMMQLRGKGRGLRKDRFDALERQREKGHLQANNKLTERDQLSGRHKIIGREKLFGRAGPSEMKQLNASNRGLEKNRLNAMRRQRKKDHSQAKSKLRGRDKMSGVYRLFDGEKLLGGTPTSNIKQIHGSDKGIRKDKLNTVRREREKDHSQAKNKLRRKNQLAGGNTRFEKERLPFGNRPFGKLSGGSPPSKMKQLHGNERDHRKDRLDSIKKEHGKNRLQQDNQLRRRDKFPNAYMPVEGETLPGRGPPSSMMQLRGKDRGIRKDRLYGMERQRKKDDLNAKNKVRRIDQFSGGNRPLGREKSAGTPPSKEMQLHGNDRGLRNEKLDAKRREREKYHSQAKNKLRGKNQLAGGNAQFGKERLPDGNRPFGKQKLSGGSPPMMMKQLHGNERGVRKDGLDSIRREHGKNTLQQDNQLRRRDKLSGRAPPSTMMQLRGKDRGLRKDELGSIRKEHGKNQLQQDKNLQRRDKLSGANIPVQRDRLSGRAPPSTMMQLRGKDRGLRKDELGSIRKEHGKNQLQQGNQLQRRDKFSGANIPVQRDRLSGRAPQSTRMQVDASDRGIRNNRLDTMRRDREKDHSQAKSKLRGKDQFAGGNGPFVREKLPADTRPANREELHGSDKGIRKDKMAAVRRQREKDHLKSRNKLRGRDKFASGNSWYGKEKLPVGNKPFGKQTLSEGGRPSNKMKMYGNDRGLTKNRLDSNSKEHGKNQLQQDKQLQARDKLSGANIAGKDGPPSMMMQLRGQDRGLRKDRLDAMGGQRKKDHLQVNNKLSERDQLSGRHKIIGGEKFFDRAGPAEMKELHASDRSIEMDRLDAMGRERERDHSQRMKKLRVRDQLAGGNIRFGKEKLPVRNKPFWKQTLSVGGRPSNKMQLQSNDRGHRKDRLGSIRKGHVKNQLQEDNQLQGRDKLSGLNMARKGERLSGRGPSSTMMQSRGKDRGLRKDRLYAMARQSEKERLQAKNKVRGRDQFAGGNRAFGREKSTGTRPSNIEQLHESDIGLRLDRLGAVRREHENDQLQSSHALRGNNQLAGGNRPIGRKNLSAGTPPSNIEQLHGSDRALRKEKLDAERRQSEKDNSQTKNIRRGKDQLDGGNTRFGKQKLFGGGRTSKKMQLHSKDRGLRKNRLNSVSKEHVKNQLQEENQLQRRDKLSGANMAEKGEKLPGRGPPSNIEQLRGKDRGLSKDRLDAMRRERNKDHSQARNKLRGRDQFASGNTWYGKEKLPVGNKPFGKQTLSGVSRPSNKMQVHGNDRGLRKNRLDSSSKEHGKNQLEQDKQLQARDKLSGANIAGKEGPPSMMMQLRGQDRGLRKDRLDAIGRQRKKENLQANNKLSERDQFSGRQKLIGGEKLFGRAGPSEMKALHASDKSLEKDRLDAMGRQREKDYSQAKSKLRGSDKLSRGYGPFGKQTLSEGGRPSKNMQLHGSDRGLRKVGLDSRRKEHEKNHLQTKSKLGGRDQLSRGYRPFGNEQLSGSSPPSMMKRLNGNDKGLKKDRLDSIRKANAKDQLQQEDRLQSGRATRPKMMQLQGNNRGLRKDRLGSMNKAYERDELEGKNKRTGVENVRGGRGALGQGNMAGIAQPSKIPALHRKHADRKKYPLDSIRKAYGKDQLQRENKVLGRENVRDVNTASGLEKIRGKGMNQLQGRNSGAKREESPLINRVSAKDRLIARNGLLGKEKVRGSNRATVLENMSGKGGQSKQKQLHGSDTGARREKLRAANKGLGMDRLQGKNKGWGRKNWTGENRVLGRKKGFGNARPSTVTELHGNNAGAKREESSSINRGSEEDKVIGKNTLSGRDQVSGVNRASVQQNMLDQVGPSKMMQTHGRVSGIRNDQLDSIKKAYGKNKLLGKNEVSERGNVRGRNRASRLGSTSGKDLPSKMKQLVKSDRGAKREQSLGINRASQKDQLIGRNRLSGREKASGVYRAARLGNMSGMGGPSKQKQLHESDLNLRKLESGGRDRASDINRFSKMGQGHGSSTPSGVQQTPGTNRASGLHQFSGKDGISGIKKLAEKNRASGTENMSGKNIPSKMGPIHGSNNIPRNKKQSFMNKANRIDKLMTKNELSEKDMSAKSLPPKFGLVNGGHRDSRKNPPGTIDRTSGTKDTKQEINRALEMDQSIGKGRVLGIENVSEKDKTLKMELLSGRNKAPGKENLALRNKISRNEKLAGRKAAPGIGKFSGTNKASNMNRLHGKNRGSGIKKFFGDNRSSKVDQLSGRNRASGMERTSPMERPFGTKQLSTKIRASEMEQLSKKNQASGKENLALRDRASAKEKFLGRKAKPGIGHFSGTNNISKPRKGSASRVTKNNNVKPGANYVSPLAVMPRKATKNPSGTFSWPEKLHNEGIQQNRQTSGMPEISSERGRKNDKNSKMVGNRRAGKNHGLGLSIGLNGKPPYAIHNVPKHGHKGKYEKATGETGLHKTGANTLGIGPTSNAYGVPTNRKNLKNKTPLKVGANLGLGKKLGSRANFLEGERTAQYHQGPEIRKTEGGRPNLALGRKPFRERPTKEQGFGAKPEATGFRLPPETAGTTRKLGNESKPPGISEKLSGNNMDKAAEVGSYQNRSNTDLPKNALQTLLPANTQGPLIKVNVGNKAAPMNGERLRTIDRNFGPKRQNGENVHIDSRPLKSAQSRTSANKAAPKSVGDKRSGILNNGGSLLGLKIKLKTPQIEKPSKTDIKTEKIPPKLNSPKAIPKLPKYVDQKRPSHSFTGSNVPANSAKASPIDLNRLKAPTKTTGLIGSISTKPDSNNNRMDEKVPKTQASVPKNSHEMSTPVASTQKSSPTKVGIAQKAVPGKTAGSQSTPEKFSGINKILPRHGPTNRLRNQRPYDIDKNNMIPTSNKIKPINPSPRPLLRIGIKGKNKGSENPASSKLLKLKDLDKPQTSSNNLPNHLKSSIQPPTKLAQASVLALPKTGNKLPSPKHNAARKPVRKGILGNLLTKGSNESKLPRKNRPVPEKKKSEKSNDNVGIVSTAPTRQPDSTKLNNGVNPSKKDKILSLGHDKPKEVGTASIPPGREGIVPNSIPGLGTDEKPHLNPPDQTKAVSTKSTNGAVEKLMPSTSIIPKHNASKPSPDVASSKENTEKLKMKDTKAETETEIPSNASTIHNISETNMINSEATNKSSSVIESSSSNSSTDATVESVESASLDVQSSNSTDSEMTAAMSSNSETSSAASSTMTSSLEKSNTAASNTSSKLSESISTSSSLKSESLTSSSLSSSMSKSISSSSSSSSSSTSSSSSSSSSSSLSNSSLSSSSSSTANHLSASQTQSASSSLESTFEESTEQSSNVVESLFSSFEESEETITSSSLFHSLTTFVEEIEIEITTITTTVITIEEEISQHTTIMEDWISSYSEATSLALFAIQALQHDVPEKFKCVRKGTFISADSSVYYTCSDAEGSLVPAFKSCPNGYIFALIAEKCINFAYPDILRIDLGIELGLGLSSPEFEEGTLVSFAASEFALETFSSICASANTLATLGQDDRFYVDCGSSSKDTLYQCPFGYFFSEEHSKCHIGSLATGTPELKKGFRVSRASPMFRLPECFQSGIFEYPDYRFYFTCQPTKGSKIYYSRKLWQCPTGYFYNAIYRGCTTASAFYGKQYTYSWNGVKTHWVVRKKMNLRSGVKVPVGSVPFHISLAEGKHSLQDKRYYYVNIDQQGVMSTRLYICHSGFYYSAKRGHCVPSFIQENMLAAYSYMLDINVAKPVGVKLYGEDHLSQMSPNPHDLLARAFSSFGFAADESFDSVFGMRVPADELRFETGCQSAGLFSTVDYRYFYSCYGKNDLGIDEDDLDDSEEDLREVMAAAAEENEDGDSIYEQLIFKCPDGLYFSSYQGFCVTPLIHHFIGSHNKEIYLWEGQRLLTSSKSGSAGIEWPLDSVPWKVNECTVEGPFQLRDPRYYGHCAEQTPKLFLCPTNMYYNTATQKCTTSINCDCWRQIGYFENPYAGFSFGPGGLQLDLHLDQSYLSLMRKITGPLNFRTVVLGKKSGREMRIFPRVICYWKEMERQKATKYPLLEPVN